jgi:Leucine-rich repeat (LRR) protein
VNILQAPWQLRELKIRDAPLSKFPESIGKLKHLEQIYVNLRRGKSNFKTLPEEFCNLRSLKTLELLNCSNMKSLPELFGNLTNLRHIDLTKCNNLERLPDSFGNLTRLKYLKLYSCSNLTISSETLGNIRTLEYINLSYCNKIEEVPPQIALQRSLEKLYCGNANLKELPSAIGVLTKLEVLYLGSTSLKALPDSLGDLRNLKQLSLLGCDRLKCLPDSVGLLTQLIELRLGCPIKELPFKRRGDSSIDNCMFPQLQRIVLLSSEVSEVSFDEGVCPNLQYLTVRHCNALTKVGTLPNTLIKLELYFCQLLWSIEGLCGPVKLEVLYITDCPNLESIWGLEKLTELRVVALLSRRLDRIRELPSVKDLRLLEKLMVPRCAVKSIQGLEQLTKLRELDVSCML